MQPPESAAVVSADPPARARRVWARSSTAAIGLLPVLAGYLFYGRWLDLFPQVEFRTWMLANADLKWFLISAFTHRGAFSRSSSFLADSVTESVCRVSIPCINAPGFWMILLATYLLFWLIVRLTGSVVGAAIAATLWVLSLPVLDGFSWRPAAGRGIRLRRRHRNGPATRVGQLLSPLRRPTALATQFQPISSSHRQSCATRCADQLCRRSGSIVAYRFVGEPGERQVDQFIYRRSAILPVDEARMNNVAMLSGSFSGYSIVFAAIWT